MINTLWCAVETNDRRRIRFTVCSIIYPSKCSYLFLKSCYIDDFLHSIAVALFGDKGLLGERFGSYG